MTSKFDEFVRKQSQQAVEENVDLVKEKADWLGKLDLLYSLVSTSLAQYIADGSIKIRFSELPLFEELLGDYVVQQAHITVGTQVANLKPKGTFLIGARGRVDMTGPRGVARFLVVPPESHAPRVRVTVNAVGSAPEVLPMQKPIASTESWVWKVASGPPRITFADLTEESFREVLMGVVGG